MSFAVIKIIHIISIVLSYILFSLRGIWMMKGSPLLKQRWVKILPHVIDTILLASAITLVTMIQQFPGFNIWLSAKTGGLLLYIFLGMIALRFGKTQTNKNYFMGLSPNCVFLYSTSRSYQKSHSYFLKL